MSEEQIRRQLIAMARKAMEQAYVPYSNFPVGAAVMTTDGAFYTGCNIESASYGATNCAERTAIFKAVSDGHRHIRRLAVVSSIPETYPCGICRQVIAEFADNIEIIIADGDGYRLYGMEDLLPHSFTRKDLIRLTQMKEEQ